HVAAGEHDRAALSHQDAAGAHGLAAEALDAEPLRIRVAAILGRGLAFLVSHGSPLSRDRGHADARELVAVAATPAVFTPALELEDLELLAAPVLDDLGGNGGTLHRGTADGDLLAVPHEQHAVERDARSRLAGQAWNVQDLVRHDLRLHS